MDKTKTHTVTIVLLFQYL